MLPSLVQIRNNLGGVHSFYKGFTLEYDIQLFELCSLLHQCRAFVFLQGCCVAKFVRCRTHGWFVWYVLH